MWRLISEKTMAKSKRTGSKTPRKSRRSSAARASGGRRSTTNDAISLLKADHRQVEQWFDQFESTRSDSRKQELARRICQALEVHTQIEHEIFYPAFLEATDEEDIHHEAEVEHNAAKKLIAEIKASGPDDDYYDAKVTVLSEMIKHHVNEEEKRDGMFAKARQSDMDLQGLGEQLASRKAQLMSESDQSDDEPVRGSRSSAAGRAEEGSISRFARRGGA
jgi:hemerythrin superfamily protein